MDESVSPFFLKRKFMNQKKYKYILFVLASLASCQRNSFVSVDEAIVRKGLTASFDSQTKVALADETLGSMIWMPEDAISFYGSSSTSAIKLTTADGGDIASFLPAEEKQADFNATKEPYYALYPYSDNCTFDSSTNSFNSILPSEQKAYEISQDKRELPLAFVAKSNLRNTMTFYNICSGIRFTVENKDITKVVLKGNSGEQLCGSFTVTPDYTSVTVSGTEPTANSVSLVSDATLIPGYMYYISFLPVEFATGFTFEFYKDGSSEPFKTTTTSQNKNCVRNLFGTLYKADNQDSINNMLSGDDLSVNGPANCYIISDAGKYKFPAYKGNTNNKLTTTTSAEVLWETHNDGNEIKEGSVISNVRYNDGYIFFRVPEIGNGGNALIAAKDESDKTIWSWHIWVSPDEPDVQTRGSITFMDRNLGALSTSSIGTVAYGLLYQWGRKDPFPGSYTSSNERVKTTGSSEQEYVLSDETTGTVAYSIANPDVYISGTNFGDWLYESDDLLWAASKEHPSKTIYDPCPAGWSVPHDPDNCWPTAADVTVNKTAFGVSFNDMAKSWFPATGFITFENKHEGKLARTASAGMYHTSRGYGPQASMMAIDLTDANMYLPKTSFPKGYAVSVRCVKE